MLLRLVSLAIAAALISLGVYLKRHYNLHVGSLVIVAGLLSVFLLDLFQCVRPGRLKEPG